jgi:hypothetical protein
MDIAEKNTDTLLAQLHRTIDLIRMYDNGIQQAIQLEAPAYLIESKERVKSQLVHDFLSLMAEMNVKLSVVMEAA